MASIPSTVNAEKLVSVILYLIFDGSGYVVGTTNSFGGILIITTIFDIVIDGVFGTSLHQQWHRKILPIINE